MKRESMTNDNHELRTKVLRSIAKIGVTAALYAVLTLFLAPIAYGPLQFRVSESLTLLPILFPEAVPGLIVGCLLANTFSAYGWYDIVFGTLATAIAALLTRFIATRKDFSKKHPVLMPIVAAIPPVVINALILPIIWYLFMGDAGYWINMAMIFGTQAAVVYIFGMPLYFGLKKTKLF